MDQEHREGEYVRRRELIDASEKREVMRVTKGKGVNNRGVWFELGVIRSSEEVRRNDSPERRWVMRERITSQRTQSERMKSTCEILA